MRIDRLIVKNFRNLADVDLRLEPGAVIVGENRAGKSNLIHAVRLVLDPTLSYRDRHLSRADFWDGLSDGSDSWDPMTAGHVIEVSIDVIDFEDEPTVATALSNALVEYSPMRARLTYRFGPIDTGDSKQSNPPKYRAQIFGGDNEDLPIARDLRDYLYLAFLPALRDVETDLASWRRSPLRTLLEAAAKAVSDEDLAFVRQAMKDANDKVNGLEEIKQVGTSISDRILEIVGANQALETELAVAADDPQRLIRNMKVLVDGAAHRPLGSTSLGTLNVLYLALLELGLEQQLEDADIAHVVMAIEEPEAHLHPHMQRTIFRRLLRQTQTAQTTIVTTQSPHIASVARPQSLVVLRNVDGQTHIAAAHEADLSPDEWDDMARYLDATRAELVFARKVLLVEGYAEQVLAPRLAASLDIDLDKAGITVCAVNGTHFDSYVRFCAALEIPWALFTDGDLNEDGSSDGQKRATKLMNLLGRSGSAESNGIFVGGTTLEMDLLTAGIDNVGPCLETLIELTDSQEKTKTIIGWASQLPEHQALIKMIKAVGGKGRYAQRLAFKEVEPPEYIARALRYLDTQ